MIRPLGPASIAGGALATPIDADRFVHPSHPRAWGSLSRLRALDESSTTNHVPPQSPSSKLVETMPNQLDTKLFQTQVRLDGRFFVLSGTCLPERTATVGVCRVAWRLP